MTDLLQRLRERKLVQWALAYVAAAFALLQGLDIVAQQFGWPDGVRRGITIALAIGFFVTLVLAWYHGERGAQRLSGTELLILSLLLAIGGSLLWRVAQNPLDSAREPAAVNSTDFGRAAQASAASDKSIAVLPFLDLSPSHDQGYFSDGMSEEILNALAQVKDLKVAGRTSSFYFKDRNEDLRTIGKTLGVANILEGSVRKQGDKVRITAQLIQVSDDTHLWSHDYDGDLSDVFKLQDNIARAITDQLKVVLVGGQNTRLVPVATTNTEAYNLYLQATAVLNKRDYKGMGEAIGWLQHALKLDPNFARAHAQLAMIHALGRARFGSSQVEAEQQARLAMALDPALAEPQAVLAIVARDQRRYLDDRAAMDRAMALEPDDASVNLYDAQQLIMSGYTRQGIAELDRTLAIDPLLPNALHWRAFQYLNAGDLDAAERMWTRAGEVGLSYANVGLAQIATARGDYAKARALILPYLLGNGSSDCLKTLAASASVYLQGEIGGDAPARAKALAVADECLAAKPAKVPFWVVSGLLHLDQPQQALRVIAQGPTNDEGGTFMLFWSPSGRVARRLPEFAAFAREVGFADLWDKYGAPDLCRKNIGGDYVCE